MLSLQFFRDSNYAEAALWILIGVGFLVASFRKTGKVRIHCLVAFPTFLLFGLSDVVEATTGAWWRPWWLLVWKGVCVLVLFALTISHYREKRRLS